MGGEVEEAVEEGAIETGMMEVSLLLKFQLSPLSAFPLIHQKRFYSQKKEM